MTKSLNTLCIALLLLVCGQMTWAQVSFKLSRTDATTYQVSMVPQQTLTDRLSITSTIQVSMKMKSADGFELGPVTSLLPGVEWDKGTLLKSPDGAREYDYLSIALRSLATRLLAYESGKEIPLFTFQNTGSEVSSVQLLDNANDLLIKNKNNLFNVPNHISVLGYGRKNAYIGNLADDAPLNRKVGLQRLYPNPAKDQVTVVWTNFLNGYEGEVGLAIADAGTGRVLSRATVFMHTGTNTTDLNVAHLVTGPYLVYLEKGDLRVGEGLKMLVAK